MDEHIKQALEHDLTIDITTIGRKTGQPRRLEIWFYNVDGRLFLAGPPGRRDWYANLLANPRFTFHLKESTRADIPATAKPVREESERRAILSRIMEKVEVDRRQLDSWVRASPLLEVQLDTD